MIYLDYNASTPIDPAARDAMLPFLGELHGNPSSHHALGQRVAEAVRIARAQVASLLGADPSEILFTSGGTESNNYVIQALLPHRSGKLRCEDDRRHIEQRVLAVERGGLKVT